MNKMKTYKMKIQINNQFKKLNLRIIIKQNKYPNKLIH